MKRFAIIVAGGQGLRLGGEIPKQFLPIKGRPVLFYTLEKFQGIADEIILVLPPSHIDYWLELCRNANFNSMAKLVPGGENRSDSVLNGLDAITGSGVVAIHDAVRPFVSRGLIEKLFDVVEVQGNNAVPAIPVKESLRLLENGSNYSVRRTDYVAVQTPQCFDYHKIIKAYQKAGHANFTDDASLFENAGEIINLVEGETTNIKITFPEDIAFCEALLDAIKL